VVTFIAPLCANGAMGVSHGHCKAGSGKILMGYATADWRELERHLQKRRIHVREIDQALRHLSKPDPARIIQNVSREDVARVAAHMNVPVTPLVTIFSPYWNIIVMGADAGRAIYYHEIEEIRALARMGIADPERLARDSDKYWSAHSLASWMEAQYWQRWASTEAQNLTAEAFLFGHPYRGTDEVDRINRMLQDDWNITLVRPSRVNIQRAKGFFKSKGVP